MKRAGVGATSQEGRENRKRIVRRPISPEERQAILVSRQQGASPATIAERFHRRVGVIYALFKVAHLHMGSRWDRPLRLVTPPPLPDVDYPGRSWSIVHLSEEEIIQGTQRGREWLGLDTVRRSAASYARRS